jgi:hypothetical protein
MHFLIKFIYKKKKKKSVIAAKATVWWAGAGVIDLLDESAPVLLHPANC